VTVTTGWAGGLGVSPIATAGAVPVSLRQCAPPVPPLDELVVGGTP
jgi:hypothetical protein